MKEIRVISADKDGADLHREKMHRLYTRANGKADDGVIQEAINSVNKSAIWSLPEGAWERIFGGTK